MSTWLVRGRDDTLCTGCSNDAVYFRVIYRVGIYVSVSNIPKGSSSEWMVKSALLPDQGFVGWVRVVELQSYKPRRIGG